MLEARRPAHRHGPRAQHAMRGIGIIFFLFCFSLLLLLFLFHLLPQYNVPVQLAFCSHVLFILAQLGAVDT